MNQYLKLDHTKYVSFFIANQKQINIIYIYIIISISLYKIFIYISRFSVF